MIEHVRIFLPKKTTADGVIGCVMSNVFISTHSQWQFPLKGEHD